MAIASRWHTWLFLIALAAVAILLGCRASYAWKESLIDLWIGFALNLALAWWVLADADEQHLRMPVMARQNVLIFAPLVALLYLVWSRGWLGIGWLALCTGRFLALTMVAAMVSSIAVALMRG